MAVKIGPIVQRTVMSSSTDKPSFKCHPPEVDQAIRCRECKALLVESSRGMYVCQVGLGHSKMKSLRMLSGEIAESFEGDATPNQIRKLINLIRRRSRWMRLLDSSESDINNTDELQWRK